MVIDIFHLEKHSLLSLTILIALARKFIVHFLTLRDVARA